MLKKLLAVVLVVMVCLIGVVGAYAEEDANLSLSLEGSEIGAPARVFDGELYLPLRVISEKLGYTVGWSEPERKITLTKGEKPISLALEEYKLDVDGHESFVRGGHHMVEDRTYLPQGFFNDVFGLKIIWDKAAKTVALESVQENPMTIETKKEVSETEDWKLSIQYPEIQGLENVDAQNKINSIFAKLAADSRNEGGEAAKMIAEDQLLPEYYKAETYFDYQVKYNRNGLLSVVFSNYQYAGGAHGLTVQSSYTFDLKTGEQYDLKDLFTEGTDYVSLISAEVKKQMAERDMTQTLVPFEAIREDQDCYLANDAVVVYFQAYEYYPYVFGIPEFPVEFSSMNETLLPIVK